MPLSSNPYHAQLRGRFGWVGVCHREPLECAACMQQIAMILAREIDFDLDAALKRSVGQYQAELHSGIEHAHELRRLTVEACFLNCPDFGDFPRGTTCEGIIVVDDFPDPPAVRMEVAA